MRDRRAALRRLRDACGPAPKRRTEPPKSPTLTAAGGQGHARPPNHESPVRGVDGYYEDESEEVATMSDATDLKPDFITDESGQKKAVVLSFDQYQELLEDLDDLAIIAERRDESTISHEELERRLRDGESL